jgi:Polyprenyl synthetase
VTRLREVAARRRSTSRIRSRHWAVAGAVLALAAGAESDHPFFAKGRRAVLLPEGFSELAADARMMLTDGDAARLIPFLAACDEVAIATVRHEWPFLARLVMADDRLAPQRPGVTAGALYGSLLEFPARIGAQLGGSPPAAVQALRSLGHLCGIAFQCAEDILALRGTPTRLDTSLAIAFEGRFSGVPDTLSRPSLNATDLDADQHLQATALTRAVHGCAAARRQALAFLPAVPDPASRRILRAFIDAVAAPARSRQTIARSRRTEKALAPGINPRRGPG